jgi:cation diffusion facilitator family transporter
MVSTRRDIGGSRKTVIAAAAANLAIAAIKFAAAAFTGSASMLSEGIHSLVDTANEALLLFGLARSRRPPDAVHPFGYATELYFWSFVVAMLIFSLGAGFSFYEGLSAFSRGHTVEAPLVGFAVLAASFLFEGISWTIAYRAFNRTRGGRTFREHFRAHKDPAVFVVLMEDSAACLGVAIAAAGMGLGLLTGDGRYDAAGALAIGCLLALAAFVLARETKGLLIGEAASPELSDAIRTLLSAHPDIASINELRTVHLGPHEVVAAISVDFRDGLPSERVERTVSALETEIRRRFSDVRWVYIEIQGRQDHLRLAAAQPGAGPAA